MTDCAGCDDDATVHAPIDEDAESDDLHLCRSCADAVSAARTPGFLVRDGVLAFGFSKFQRREARDANGDPIATIEHQKRMHRFDSGYQDTGRPRPLTEALSPKDARAVRVLLDEWLQALETEDGETE